MAPRVHASTFFGGRAELASCQHISLSLLNGEQSFHIQTLPSRQRETKNEAGRLRGGGAEGECV